MQHIRAENKKIEEILRKALWHKGYRYRKNSTALPGKPDIVMPKYRIAIFCDGEFFHGKDWEMLKPRLENGNNSAYWIKKYLEIWNVMSRLTKNSCLWDGLFFVFGEKRY